VAPAWRAWSFSGGGGRRGGDRPAARRTAVRSAGARGQFIRRGGIAEWPDGTVAGGNAFIHALYQQVLYGRVSTGTGGSAPAHGERLERGYGERGGRDCRQLAVHFGARPGLRARRAVPEQAGDMRCTSTPTVSRRPRDAAHSTRSGHCRTRGSAPRRVVPAGHAGTALTAAQGYAAPEVARTYARAWELYTQMRETPQLFAPSYWAIGRSMSFVRFKTATTWAPTC